MSEQKSILARLWRKLFPVKENEPRATKLSRPKPLPRRVSSADRGIEPLEGRIAPAALLPGGKVLSYTDSDGDLVKVQFSKSLFVTRLGSSVESQLQGVFTFSAGKAHSAGAGSASDDVPQILQSIDLSRLGLTTDSPLLRGLSITISAERQDANGDGILEGNGEANVGAIKASGIALGSIVVPGDLGQVDAGSNSVAVGLKSLTVKSLGKLTTTQTGTTNYESLIVGQLGSFTAQSIEGGYLHVINGLSTSTASVAIGKIGTVKIADSLRVRDFAAFVNNDGRIETTGGIDSITIGEGKRSSASVQGYDGIIGGFGSSSASITAGGNVGKIVINGDMRGGSGLSSAGIFVAGKIGSLDVNGAVIGSGVGSGIVRASGGFGSVEVGLPGGQGLVGGAGDGSGLISSDSAVGSVKISSITGTASNSGGVTALGKIGSITVEGSIQGSSTLHSGFIESYSDIGTITVGGDLVGGTGVRSGTIIAGGAIQSVSIGGKVAGGGGTSSGSIFSGVAGVGGIGVLKVGNGLLGGSGGSSGSVSAAGAIGSATVNRLFLPGYEATALSGGSGASSGALYADGSLGSLVVQGSVAGGFGENSGSITEHGLLRTASISGNVTGGFGTGSGAILALDMDPTGDAPIAGALGKVIVGGSLAGGGGVRSGQISADGGIQSLIAQGLFSGAGSESGRVIAGGGSVAVGDIGTLSLGTLGKAADANGGTQRAGGTVLAFGRVGSLSLAETFGASVRVGGDLGSVIVAGDVTNTTFSAVGQASPVRSVDLALGAITVGGDVTASNFLGGYSVTGTAANGHAQIGNVKIAGDWVASNLVAGIRDVGGTGFGDADDRPIEGSDNPAIVSRIASVIIEGNVSVPASNSGHYGFVAQQIGTFKTAAGSIALTAAGGEVFELLPAGSSATATVRETPVA